MSRPQRAAWTLAALLWAAPGAAQVDLWKVGGSGLSWSQIDSTELFIDFDEAANAVQPIYFEPDRTVFSYMHERGYWRDESFWREPRYLGFVAGEAPRMWKWDEGIGDPSESGIRMIDGDSTTFNPPKADDLFKQFFTIDLGVPVPAVQVGFFTPTEGFSNDGFRLRTVAVPAFELSIAAAEGEAVQQFGSTPLPNVVASLKENFAADVRLGVQRQYARFMRFTRLLSLVDAEAQAKAGNNAIPLTGAVGDFEIFARGVASEVNLLSAITDLGVGQNFGRIFWSGTPMRLVDGVAVEDPGADVGIRVEVRSGRDPDPNVYHDFTELGLERVVSREEYEELRPRQVRITAAGALQTRSPKPGLKASIDYDSENWTFWSPAFTEPGQPLNLASGTHIQFKVTLESREFDAYMRLDSLWIEMAPLLAGEIVGELARLDDPRPSRGVAEVDLGEMTDFVYDLKARFDGGFQPGFDRIRLRTGNRTLFKELQAGDPLAPVEPLAVEEDRDGITVHLPRRVTAADNPPLRLVFGTEVFDFATSFLGEAVDSERETLAQQVNEGDAGPELSTNSLRVLGSAGGAQAAVQNIRFSTPVLTPNGDGANDRVEISYELFRLPEAVGVAIEVYGLDGRRLARVPVGSQASGPQTARWDGRDADGRLLPPGTYLLNLSLDAESNEGARLRPLGIAY